MRYPNMRCEFDHKHTLVALTFIHGSRSRVNQRCGDLVQTTCSKCFLSIKTALDDILHDEGKALIRRGVV